MGFLIYEGRGFQVLGTKDPHAVAEHLVFLVSAIFEHKVVHGLERVDSQQFRHVIFEVDI
jgi:hypothetical protein